MNYYSKEFSTLLKTIAEALDIPESYFEQAKKRYESIGDWLERDGSKVSLQTGDLSARFFPIWDGYKTYFRQR